MGEGISEIGKLSGKRVYKIPLKNVEESVLETFFSTLNFMELALQLSKLSLMHFKENGPLELKGAVFNDDILCRAFELAIKYASKDGGRIPTEDNLVDVLQYAAGEAEKYFFSGINHPALSDANPTDAEILMTRIAYTQFFEKEYNLIARYWYIYAYLWNENRTSFTSPLDDIKEMIGASYKEIVVYGLVVSFQPYIRGLNLDEKKELSELLKEEFSDKGFDNFLDYFSCSQQEWSCCENPPPPKCNLKPIVRSEQKSLALNEVVCFIPARNKLMQRITAGLYFDLCNKYNRGGGDNPFKNEFGMVFERYVENILKESLTSYNISSQIEYGKNGEKSVDFLIKKDCTLVLIEVKQSSIFWKSKVSGKEIDLRNDMRNTILKAVKQINHTKSLIESKKCEPFSNYYNCTQMIGLIVVNDPLYNANDLCRKIISNSGLIVNDIYVINISDLEDFLDLQKPKQDFWSVLKNKQNGRENYDFKEYLSEHYDYSQKDNRFLEKFYREVIPVAEFAK